jgi:two-component system, cell cycle response regulator
VTLRARLTAAFLAVVLGPVVLGAAFVGFAVAAVGADRTRDRLDVAVAEVVDRVAAACQRLHAAAETTALLSGSGLRPDAVLQVVGSGLASAAQLVRVDGRVVAGAGPLPAKPWADCASPGTGTEPARALVAAVDIHDAQSRLGGRALAVEPVDRAFLDRLSSSSGARVGVGSADSRVPGLSLRRLDPVPDQPLPLTVSVPVQDLQGLYLVLVAVVVCAGLVAIGAAWWLARSTTQPLTELSYAVDRVASGDLAARVPVRTQDEVGRLGTTFNRMTREMQGYVQALTASRDQLRGQLGVLGDTLSSTHDLHRILQVILQTAMAATGAQSGVVLLVDASGGTLVGQCAEGLTGVENLRVRLGEGLLGGVAASGEPRRGRVDRDGPALSTSEPQCLTYVAVPFAAPGAGTVAGADPVTDTPAARGVLALYDRHGFDEFDDADLVTLRTFAGQTAVALDNVRVHEEAQRLSLTDPLTGLSNYRYLKESLRREVERASRFGRTLAVVALDLDRFKDINDTYGHAAGDAVLAEFARRLRSEIREVDFAFRQGGEEFVVLLPETDVLGGAVVAQRLGIAVRGAPVLVVPAARDEEAIPVPVTVSIGVAVYPDHGADGPAVLEAADDALYAAKAAGRDTYRIAASARTRENEEPSVGASPGAHPPRQSRGG